MTLPFELNKVHCVDCLEAMRLLPDKSVDLVLTDPPYGIKRFEKGFGYTRFRGYGCETRGIEWDVKPCDEVFEHIFRISKHRIIWGSNNFILPPSQCFLVWDKIQTVPNFAGAELAFCDADGVTAKIFHYGIHAHNQTEKHHVTQKPVPLFEWCLTLCSKPDGLILDRFMGSGTTGVAAIQTGRRFLGFEISPEYCKLANDRCEAARQGLKLSEYRAGQQSLFGGEMS